MLFIRYSLKTSSPTMSLRSKLMSGSSLVRKTKVWRSTRLCGLVSSRLQVRWKTANRN